MYFAGSSNSVFFHCLMTFLFYSHTASYGATKSLQVKGGLNEPPNYYGSQKLMKNCIPLGREGKNKQNIREADQ